MESDPAARRPGRERAWWLREALAADPGAPCPPLVDETTADVVVLGGGYTGLWSAYFLTEQAPGTRVVVLEQDICGGGPSGRNGGFVTAWWDELPAMVEMWGAERALATARAVGEAVPAIGEWCARHGVDAWFRHAGYLQVSAAPAQDRAWERSAALCREMGVAEEYTELAPAEVQARCASPAFRAGVLMRDGATVQPAFFVRGLRRVLLERGVTIHEGTRVVRIRPGGEGAPVRVETAGGSGGGASVTAERAIVATNAWSAGWPWFGRSLVAWSSYMVLTEPIPERLAELGWTGGEAITDSRFSIHYFRTTPDGRIAFGGGGGRAGYGGRIGPSFSEDAVAVRRAAEGLRRLFPSLRDVRIVDAWGGPIDVAADHLPFFGTLPGGRVHYGMGYSGNGVAPSHLGARILAALALGRDDDPLLALPLVGTLPRSFPPEPFRYLGARVVREAIVRKERAAERGRPTGRLVDFLASLPRRMGYRLGVE